MTVSLETKRNPRVKAIIGVLFRYHKICAKVFQKINKRGWKVQLRSKVHAFNISSYYQHEMGRDLERFFFSLENPIPQTEIVGFKQELVTWENELKSNGQRTVNLDAGYLDLHRVVLLSSKEGPSKIHLSAGIWADLNLLRKNGSYQSLPWTFPDIRDGRYHEFFEKAREAFKCELRTSKKIQSSLNE